MFVVAVKNSSKKLKSTEILNALNETYSETESPQIRDKEKQIYESLPVQAYIRNNNFRR